MISLKYIIATENYRKYSELRKSQTDGVWGSSLNKKAKTPTPKDGDQNEGTMKSTGMSHIRQRIMENSLKSQVHVAC